MARTHNTLDRSTLDRSTMLASYAYDPDTRRLDVTFRSGQTYTYEDVPEDVYEGLRDADSPGSYYNSSIKNTYA